MAGENFEITIRAIDEISDRVKAIEATLSQFAQKTVKGQADIQKSTDATSNSVKTGLMMFAGFVGIPVTLMAVIGAVKSLWNETLRWSVEMKNLSLRMGLTVEQLQVFEFAAQKANVGLSGMQRLMFQLTSVMDGVEKGTLGAGAKFEKFGIDIKGIIASGGGANEILRAVSSTLREMKDPLERLKVMKDLFGRYGLTNLPILLEDLNKLDKETTIISEAAIERLTKVESSIGTRWFNWKKFWKGVVADIVETVGVLSDTEEERAKKLDAATQAASSSIGTLTWANKSLESTRDKAIKQGKNEIEVLTIYCQEIEKRIALGEKQADTDGEVNALTRNMGQYLSKLGKVLSDLNVKQKESNDRKEKEIALDKDFEKAKEKVEGITKRHSNSIRNQLVLVEAQLNLTQEGTEAYKLLTEQYEELQKAISKEDTQRELSNTLSLFETTGEKLGYLLSYLDENINLVPEEVIKIKQQIFELQNTLKKEEVYNYAQAWRSFANTIAVGVSGAFESLLDSVIRGTGKIKLILRKFYQDIIKDMYKEFIGAPLQMAVKNMLLGTGAREGRGLGGGLFTSTKLTPQVSAEGTPGFAHTEEFNSLKALGFAVGTSIALGGMQKGNVGMGTAGGALAGFSVGGPIGAVIGGVAGLISGVAGKEKEKKKKKKVDRAIEVEKARIWAEEQKRINASNIIFIKTLLRQGLMRPGGLESAYNVESGLTGLALLK